MNLNVLNFSHNLIISGQFFTNLSQSSMVYPSLQSLDLSYCPYIQGVVDRPLFSVLPNLRVLKVAGVPGLLNRQCLIDMFYDCCEYMSVHELNLQSVDAYNFDMMLVIYIFPNLRVLNLDWNRWITNTLMERLPMLVGLGKGETINVGVRALTVRIGGIEV